MGGLIRTLPHRGAFPVERARQFMDRFASELVYRLKSSCHIFDAHLGQQRNRGIRNTYEQVAMFGAR